jgi:hypothetical protein
MPQWLPRWMSVCLFKAEETFSGTSTSRVFRGAGGAYQVVVGVRKRNGLLKLEIFAVNNPGNQFLAY